MTTPSHLSEVWFKVTDLQVESGHGCWVTTVDGTEYLDFSAGIAVVSTGHCHPYVVEAIQHQAERFIHAQVNVYRHDLLEPLAARLAEITPAGIERFFYANSGAEITEAAVKLARQATKRPNIIVFAGSFHGRTHLAMAMTTSKTGYRAGHSPDGLQHLLKSMTAPDETAAMILEPVLGEGGYIPAPARFIQGVVEICRQHGILFIADEVQSGFGRTGRMFAVEHFDVEPDIICMAKGIASGFPFAALGTTEELSARWPTGSHGGTYGGNAIGCAAALATIEVVTAPGFMENVNERGEQLQRGLREIQAEDAGITQVRGLGLMIGTDFNDPARVAAVQSRCLSEGHLIVMNAGTYGRTLRWMPPLIVNEREIDLALAAFGGAVKATS